MGEYFQRSSNFVIGFFVYIATIYAKSEIMSFQAVRYYLFSFFIGVAQKSDFSSLSSEKGRTLPPDP